MDKQLFEKTMHDLGGHIVNLKLFSELIEEGLETLDHKNFFSIVSPCIVDFDIIRYYSGYFYDTSNFETTIKAYGTEKNCNINFHKFETGFTRSDVSILCNFIIFLIKTLFIKEIDITSTDNGVSILAKNCDIESIEQYSDINLHIKLLMELKPKITQKKIGEDSQINFSIEEEKLS